MSFRLNRSQWLAVGAIMAFFTAVWSALLFIPASPLSIINQGGGGYGSHADFHFYETPTLEQVNHTMNIKVESHDGYYPEADLLVGMMNWAGDDISAPVLIVVDDHGNVKRQLDVTNKVGAILGDRRWIDDDRVMYTIFKDGAYISNLETLETEKAYTFPEISHHAEIMPNGNVMLVGSFCDCIQERDYDTGEVLWSWSARDTFRDYHNDDDYYMGGSVTNIRSMYANFAAGSAIFPDDWTHLNHAQYLPESDTFIASLRNFDLVVEVNRAGEVVWSYGPGILKQQHTPRVLDDNTMLVFDNGNHRAIRIDRETQEIIWQYDDIFAPAMGDVSLLADGNYKVVDSFRSTIKVVSPDEELLWSLEITSPDFPQRAMYRAHFYGIEQ